MKIKNNKINKSIEFPKYKSFMKIINIFLFIKFHRPFFP